MKIKLEPELVYDLYTDEIEDDCYRFVTVNYYGQWRWGVNYELVIQDKVTGKYFAAICQEQTGDHYYNSFDPEHVSSPIEFYEVEPYEITLTKYKKVADATQG